MTLLVTLTPDGKASDKLEDLLDGRGYEIRSTRSVAQAMLEIEIADEMQAGYPDGFSAVALIISETAFTEELETALYAPIARARAANFPVFVLLKGRSIESCRFALEQSFDDYLESPLDATLIMHKLSLHFDMRRMRAKLNQQQKSAVKASRSVQELQNTAIMSLAAMARVRDTATGNHTLRTQHYMRVLAEKLASHPRFKAELHSDERIDLFVKSAAVHDIGKVAIPDSILLKPGKLTADEFKVMRKHTLYGFHSLLMAQALLDDTTNSSAHEMLTIGKQITLSHHERWDGQGYPQGLSGEDIPVSARIMAVADVYDALSSARPYKSPLSHTEVCQMIIQGRGSHFDPDIVDAFVESQAEFEEICGEMEDLYPATSDLAAYSLHDLNINSEAFR